MQSYRFQGGVFEGTFYCSSHITLIECLNTLIRYTKLKMEANKPELSYSSTLLQKTVRKVSPDKY